MKRNVKFNSSRERHMSRGSMDSSPVDEKRSNGAKSPTRNGDLKRPQVDRNDTGASGWATDTEGEEKKVRANHRQTQTPMIDTAENGIRRAC